MTDRELTEVLQRGHVPDRSADYWREFPDSVSRRLRQSASQIEATVAKGRANTLLRWGFALGTGFLVILLFIGRHEIRSTSRQRELTDARKVATEVLALFPNQVRAIIILDGQTQLLLADTPTVAASTPIFLRICDREDCARVITFSGQQVNINGKACDVLLNGKGEVIVAGRDFVWTTSQARHAGTMGITAQPLEGTL